MSKTHDLALEVPETGDRSAWLELARLAEEERRLQGDRHLQGEDLTAYAAGELSAEKVVEVQAHLAVCPDCTRAFLSLSSFYREAETPILPVASGAEATFAAARKTNASWQAVRGQVLPSLPFWTRIIRSQVAAFGAVAACLIACLIVLSLRMADHHGEVTSVTAAVLPLEAGDVTRGAEGEVATSFELQGDSLTVEVKVPQPRLSKYKMEIRDQKGKIVASEETTSWPSVRVTFPTDKLQPGDYKLVLRSASGELVALWNRRFTRPAGSRK